jgi:hypothetical protein
MAKKLTRSRTVVKLDTIFSKFIRLSNADKNGYCNCFTCGSRAYWTNDGVDAGHFMSRKHYSTRWDERNVKPQCKICNMYRNGEQYKFSQILGKDLSEELYQLSKKTVKYSTGELNSMAEHYKKLVKELEKDYI